VPPWVSKPINDINEFVLDGDTDHALQCSVIGIRGRVMALAGMVEHKTGANRQGFYFSWASARYTTVFILTGEARSRLRPRYAKLRPTAWDKIAGDAIAPV
jgi:hypothetical protein